MEEFVDLGLALTIGLLIGAERGWQERSAAEGARVAGIRTFGLIGLLGGLWAVLGRDFGEIVLGFAFFSLAGLLVVAHFMDVRTHRDVGITTVVAALITFSLGALAASGHHTVAAAGAVITTILLQLKPILHGWLKRLEEEEMAAALKLLLISVVLLPVLPNQGYGPWQAINPYTLWWMVVLIASISFVGYFTMKIVGARRGIMLTSLLGGLMSSTAVALSFSRLAQRLQLPNILAAGILVAAATMFPRMLLEVAVINRSLLIMLVWPLSAMALVTYLGAAWLWRKRQRGGDDSTELPLRNPLELLTAIRFGLLLACVMLLADGFRHWFGDLGIYVLAVISGIADVDAITLSLARMAHEQIMPTTAVQAIVLAAISNSLVKGGLVLMIAGSQFAKRVLFVMLAAALTGGIVLLLTVNLYSALP